MDMIIGVTGASGTIYAVKLLEALKKTESVTTHVIFSDYARVNLEIETGYTIEDVLSMADHSYDNRDLAACISSGSYPAAGVIILPCSMKTLSGIANGYADNLITRVCDVALKERRRLVICPRETPLNTIHLKHMYELSQMGAVIAPPMPAFYNHPETVEDIVNHQIMKILDQFRIPFEDRPPQTWVLDCQLWEFFRSKTNFLRFSSE